MTEKNNKDGESLPNQPEETKQPIEKVAGKMEEAVKETVTKENAAEVRKELDTMVTRAELEARMEQMQKEYAKARADYEKLQKDINRAKAQGKATFFDQKEEDNSDLKRLYPDLCQLIGIK